MAVTVSKKLGSAGSPPLRTNVAAISSTRKKTDAEIIVANHGAIDLDAFIDAAQVRRGVKTRPIAGAGKNAGQGRRGGSFTVGAGNQYGGEVALSIA